MPSEHKKGSREWQVTTNNRLVVIHLRFLADWQAEIEGNGVADKVSGEAVHEFLLLKE